MDFLRRLQRLLSLVPEVQKWRLMNSKLGALVGGFTL